VVRGVPSSGRGGPLMWWFGVTVAVFVVVFLATVIAGE
jgi:hypothetical protein